MLFFSSYIYKTCKINIYFYINDKKFSLFLGSWNPQSTSIGYLIFAVNKYVSYGYRYYILEALSPGPPKPSNNETSNIEQGKQGIKWEASTLLFCLLLFVGIIKNVCCINIESCIL